MKTLLGVMLAGVAVVAAAPSAYAASQDFCTQYASQAVTQQGENTASQCGFTGPRWHDNFAVHLTWCLSANEDQANSEAEARSTELSQCTGGGEELGDEELGDEDFGEEELGDEGFGDEELGDEDLGDEELGDEDLGDEELGDADEPDGDDGSDG